MIDRSRVMMSCSSFGMSSRQFICGWMEKTGNMSYPVALLDYQEGWLSLN